MVSGNGQSPNGTGEFDLAAALGAQEGTRHNALLSTFRTRIKNGKEIGNQRKWILEALALLTELHAGATATPPTEGVWGDDQGELIWKHTVVVYSFIRAEKFHANLPRIREFLHRMGRETNQGEVAFEFETEFYLIRDYDPLAESNGDVK